ncbi:uncharacterized protein LOC134180277 isoform X2 [Corticium candelabrum]|uniref:uncharacterized protein LOC134180277 isoform X2 n=1 Tax=Corticium candelabrum TaxID=121492 RepID=UPI002E265DC1|nr:uncharacterized protein LOC134180277 isoform X2 [Corticium candelabrum]XP_062503380.1 uncharacterized protein LOC134180277 isoform X2 [Corticium candelabrum]
MFVWGGRTAVVSEFHSRLNVLSVNMISGVWHAYTAATPDTPTPCTGACSAVSNNTIYSHGGRTSWSPLRRSEEMYKLNIEEMRWRRVETKGTKPAGRNAAAMCSVNGKLLMMGGHGSISLNKLHPQAEYKKDTGKLGEGRNNELWSFELESGCWSPVCVTGSKPSPRDGHTLTAVDEKRVLLFGGYDGRKCLNDLWLFDYTRKMWTHITPSSLLWPQPRYYHTMCIVGCKDEEIKILLMGGYDGSVMKDCWMIDVMRGSSEKLVIDGEIFGRYGHCAGCITLPDGTVAISAFGGYSLSGAVVASPCFYHWNLSQSTVLHVGIPAARVGLHAVSRIAANTSLAGGMSQKTEQMAGEFKCLLSGQDTLTSAACQYDRSVSCLLSPAAYLQPQVCILFVTIHKADKTFGSQLASKQSVGELVKQLAEQVECLRVAYETKDRQITEDMQQQEKVLDAAMGQREVLQTERGQMQAQIENMQKQIENLRKEKMSLQEALTEEKSNNGDLQHALNKEQRDKAQLQRDLHEEQLDKQNVQDTLCDALRKNNELQHHIHDEQEQKMMLQQDLNEEQTQKQQLIQEKMKLQQELNEEQTQKQQLISDKHALEQALHEKQREKGDVEELLAVARVANTQSRKKLRQSKEVLKILSGDIRVTEHILGHGAYGDVHIAYWQGCPVAVKMLYDTLLSNHSNVVELLQQEVSVAWKIHHPNIVLVCGMALELEEQKKTAWIVMELLQGSVAGVIEAAKKEDVLSLTLREKLDVTHDALCGLNYLHSLPNAILHGDIRPSNILVSRVMNAKLGDLGAARFTDTSLSAGFLSPDYIAPERLDGRSAQKNEETDVYSMGVTLCELFTSVSPDRSHRLEQLLLIQHSRVGALCARMVSDDPDRRPLAAEVLADIDHVRQTAEYKACPPKRMVKGKLDGVEDVTLTDCLW